VWIADGYTEGSTATLQCGNGYYPANIVTSCSANGRWLAVDFRCTPCKYSYHNWSESNEVTLVHRNADYEHPSILLVEKLVTVLRHVYRAWKTFLSDGKEYLLSYCIWSLGHTYIECGLSLVQTSVGSNQILWNSDLLFILRKTRSNKEEEQRLVVSESG
jgi:hypothetical protein